MACIKLIAQEFHRLSLIVVEGEVTGPESLHGNHKILLQKVFRNLQLPYHGSPDRGGPLGVRVVALPRVACGSHGEGRLRVEVQEVAHRMASDSLVQLGQLSELHDIVGNSVKPSIAQTLFRVPLVGGRHVKGSPHTVVL